MAGNITYVPFITNPFIVYGHTIYFSACESDAMAK